MLNVIIVPKVAGWEQFSADVERNLADWQPSQKRTLEWQLRKAAKSFNHSYNFELPNKFDGAGAMAHQKIRHVWKWCATISEDAQGKASATQSPNTRFSEGCVDRCGKTKDTGIKCSETGIQKKNCKAGTLEWEKNSVIMQNTINHVNSVNRHIREDWKIKQ